MRAQDLMTTKVVTVTAETPVVEIAELLLKHHISGTPVVDAETRVIGIVSEGDLLRRPEIETDRRRPWWLGILAGSRDLAREYVKTHGVKAADVMTREVVTVDEDTAVGEIASILEDNRIKRVPVIRKGKLVGVVSRGDIVRGLATLKKTMPVPGTADDRAIRQRILKTVEEASWGRSPYVQVIVTGGVAHLWGLVESDEERNALRVACETVPGVKAVENHLVKVPTWIGSA